MEVDRSVACGMPATRTRPPVVADERTQLLGWYDLQRGIVRLKCEGLGDEDAHRSLIPTSPLTTVAGIVSHLASTGGPLVPRGPPGGALDLPGLRSRRRGGRRLPGRGAPPRRGPGRYEAACARSDAAIAEHSLDDTGSTAIHRVGEATLRWMLLHMLEETARHAGHLDLLREMLDGETGYF